jgi:hypothetical protein
MNETVAACVELIKKAAAKEEDQLVLADAVLKALATKTHISKLKEIPELIVCKALNLRWVSDKIHGADAYDAHGRAVELKTFAITKGKTKGISINYTCKETRTDTLQHYASSNFAGGHYWVAMNGRKTDVLWAVHLSQKDFLNLLREKETHKLRLNFGSTLCNVCQRCARVDRIVGIKPCNH